MPYPTRALPGKVADFSGSEARPNKDTSRAADLDLLKTLLVVGMIGAHVIQLITFRAKPEAVIFAEYVNLVTFSGFMFAFGIGIGLPKPPAKHWHLGNRLRPVLAVYASSFAFALWVDRKPLNAELILDVVTMRRLFGWSEFLATFFMLSLVTSVARPALVAIGRNPWLLLAATVACLATTFYTTGAILPLLPYLPWFLLGIWYGSHPVRAWHFVPALAITGYLYWVTIQTGQFPNRFPPTILWIVGPAAILLAYLALCRLIAARVSIPRVLLTPGRHVLSFLVLSNLAFFATRYFMGKPVRSTLIAALVTLAVVAALSAGWYAWEKLRPTRRQPEPAPAQ